MADDGIPTSTRLGRSYMVTRGRTETAASVLPVETMVVPSDEGWARRDRLVFERHRLVTEVDQPTSVVEIAARLGVPLLAGQVLVSEMVAEGLLDTASVAVPQSGVDIEMLLRIRERIATL